MSRFNLNYLKAKKMNAMEQIDMSGLRKELIEAITNLSNEDLLKVSRILARKRVVLSKLTDLVELHNLELPRDLDIIIEGEVRDLFINKKINLKEGIVKNMYE